MNQVSAPKRISIGLLLVLLSPMAVVPGGLESHSLAQAAVAGLGVCLILSVLAATQLNRQVSYCVVAASLSLTAATFVSADPFASLFGRYPRYEGVWTLVVYVGCAYAGSRLATWGRVNQLLVGGMALVSLAVLIPAMWQALAGPPDSRIESMFGNPNELGLWAAMSLVLLLPFALKREALPTAGAIASVALVLMSGSRGALLAAAVGAVVLFILVQQKLQRRRLALALGLVGGIALLVPMTRLRLMSQSRDSADTWSIRTNIWDSAVSLVSQRPVAGLGPSQFVDRLGEVRNDELVSLVGNSYVIDSPHNAVLQVLLAGGLLLAVCCLALVIFWFRTALPKANAGDELAMGTFSAVTAGMVGLMFHFTSPGTTPLLVLLAGFAAHAPKPVRHVNDHFQRTSACVATGVAALVLGAAALSEISMTNGVQSIAQGDAASGRRSFETVLAMRPWDKDASVRVARAYGWAVSSGALAASECIQPSVVAVGVLPRSSEAVIDRAKCLGFNNQIEEARDLVEDALPRHPNDVELLLLSGRAALILNERDVAGTRFGRVLEMRPQNREALRGLREAAQPKSYS